MISAWSLGNFSKYCHRDFMQCTGCLTEVPHMPCWDHVWLSQLSLRRALIVWILKNIIWKKKLKWEFQLISYWFSTGFAFKRICIAYAKRKPIGIWLVHYHWKFQLSLPIGNFLNPSHLLGKGILNSFSKLWSHSNGQRLYTMGEWAYKTILLKHQNLLTGKVE